MASTTRLLAGVTFLKNLRSIKLLNLTKITLFNY